MASEVCPGVRVILLDRAASFASRSSGPLAAAAAAASRGTSAVLRTAHRIAPATARLLRQAMDYCRSLDMPVIDHCEDPSLFAGAVMREGRQSVRLGLHGMPAAAESIVVARDIQIAELTGVGMETVKSRIRYALGKLKRELRGEARDLDDPLREELG